MNKISVIPQDDAPSSQLPAHSEASAVLHMIERVARDPAVDMDKMMQLMSWRKEIIADQRRAEFDEAMASAKAEIPIISKNREVDFTSTKGRTYYKYEDLAEVARVVSPILGKFGLSYRYRVTSNVNEPVTVTCVVSHRGGHFETVTLTGGRDESGNKNSIQAVASTLTYLQRMTLKAALGLAASDDDDSRATSETADKHAESAAPPEGSITEAQADQITDLLESREVSRTAFLQWAKQKRVIDIPAEHFDACITAISNFKPKAK